MSSHRFSRKSLALNAEATRPEQACGVDDGQPCSGWIRFDEPRSECLFFLPFLIQSR